MMRHKEVHLALRALLLSVPTLPAARVWENAGGGIGTYQPVQGVPYVDESYNPSTNTLLTTVRRGQMLATGFYYVNWFGVAGADIVAIRDGVDDVLAKFVPGSSVALASGHILRIAGDPAPAPGQIIPLTNGFAFCKITIPWSVESYLST